ncbi:MAG TPA: transcriptional regulator [Porphyromonadaceae bacterium]|jgi:ribosome-binding protein aMBF1 (putative translation factor)|nr:transcriptional regulator [Porphyromonadaceae bacterium]
MNIKKKNMELYDVSAELEREFGKIGSIERNKAEQEAWEDYNAQILLDARKNAGLTQAQLAERVGVDKGYISRVERGIIVPSIGTFYKIVSAMGLSVELRPAL